MGYRAIESHCFRDDAELCGAAPPHAGSGREFSLSWNWPVAVLLGVCTTFTAPAISTAADDVFWITDLETDSKLIGREVTAEGAFQQRVGASRDQIVLRGCKVAFQVPPEVLKALPSSLTGGLRITGTLAKQEGKLTVRVKSVERITATDVDRFRSAAVQIAQDDARGWYQLADRTQRLAVALESGEIRGLAADSRRKGFRAEERLLRPTQVQELLEMAGRVEQVGLGEDETRRLRHKALRWQSDQLQQSKSATAAAWKKLAADVSKLLPGAQTARQTADAPALERYRAKPIEVYDADLESRNSFDRYFYVDAAGRELLAASVAPNADLLQLAADAKRRVPERPELSQQLLEKWADVEATRVPKLPPASQVQQLVDVLRNDLKKPDRANAILRQWYDARREKLGRSADGRVQLAREFRKELNDDATAAKLLLEALELEPDLPQAIEELKSLGYVKGPNGWTRGSDQAVARATAVSARSKLPEVGMTPDLVRGILGPPKPEDVIRVATAGRVIEQWSYYAPDIHVTFLVSAAGTKVLRINTQTGK